MLLESLIPPLLQERLHFHIPDSTVSFHSEAYRSSPALFLQEAKELTLYDVYTAIDPEFFIIDCLEPGYQCTCDGSGNQACTVHRELQRVQKELCKMLQEKNLEDIFHLENRNRL